MSAYNEDAVTGFPANASVNRAARWRWLSIPFATLTIATILGIAHTHRTPAPNTTGRSVRLRLSGFDWSPYRPPTTYALTWVTDLRRGANARGVAELLTGNPRRAMASLSMASESSADPLVWNDLAAAAYETAERYDTPELLTDALAAADRALALAPEMPEALFNRASILQRLGLRDDARMAWNQYLLHETNGEWANEAREQLRLVQPEPSFLDVIDRYPERLRELVNGDPQGARLHGSIDVLARWAETGGSKHLDMARELGTHVAARNGERTLEQAVRAIDMADDATRRVLANAHVAYAKGWAEWNGNRPVAAEGFLLHAADGFAKANSPLAYAAREASARMMYEQGRDADARRQHEALLREVPLLFPAIRAQSHWQLGVVDTSAGRWGPALRHLEQASAAFERLGETGHASRAERLIAFVYDRIGDSERAWRHRMVALRGLGKSSSLALEKTVESMALAEMSVRKWHVAESLLNLEVDIATRLRDDVQLTEALFYRAIARLELGDDARARRDADEIEIVMARLEDPAYRAYFQADALVLRARLEPSPTKAVALLSSAIDFMKVKGDGMDLPKLFLHRARLLRKSGDTRAAVADLQRGMDGLEASRESLPSGEARWGVFHAHEELFEDAIDIAVDNDDAAAALVFAERARARALLDSYDRTAPFDPGQLPPDTLLVEVVALPKRIALIIAERTAAVRIVTADVDRALLTGEIDTFIRALRDDDMQAAKRAGTLLHRRLVAPIPAVPKTIVFVPDSTTSIIPFSALVDEQGVYLLERHAFVVAPSASVFVAARRRRPSRPPQSVLIVANDKTEQPLSYVRAESRGVASAYRTAREIHDAAELQKEHSADALHFAGHAVGDESGLEPASILLRENGQEKRMSVAEIAKLRLQHPSVVVLAGCSTARGQRRSTEGAISVAYGFLTAGAPSVIATLWPIEDEAAAEFFPRLHRRLAEGLPPAEALRAVQLDAIRRGDTPASLWASLHNIGS